MKKIIILFTLVFTLMCSTVAFANNVLGSNWVYIGQEPFADGVPSTHFYYDVNSVYWLNDNNLKVLVCLYFPPSPYNPYGIYGFYDDVINGKENSFCIFRIGWFERQNGVLSVKFSYVPDLIWKNFSPNSLYKSIYNSCLYLK